MQYHFDILVVGAGPAGCTAAKFAARQGLDVLLIDKKKTIGIPVCCGELFASPALIVNAFPHLKDMEELFSIEPSLIQRNISRMIIISPKGRPYEFEWDGFTVNRDSFDQYLAKEAVDEGTTLLTDTKFLNIDGCEVKTSKGVFETNIVIAADGPLSQVCISAGMERNSNLAHAVTCQVQGEFDDAVRLYFGKRIAPGGYAWIIPKDGCANVGLGIQNSSISLKRCLNSFLERNGFTASNIQGGFVPISGPIRKTGQRKRPCSWRCRGPCDCM